MKDLEDDNARWTKQTFQPLAAGGTPLPSDLVAHKAASDADRLMRRNARSVVIPPISTITAVIEKWQRQQSQFFESVFNYQSLVNCVVTWLVAGRELSVELIAEAFHWLLENHMVETAPDEYFDPQARAIVRKRGNFISKIAPTMFPKYLWPADETAAREAELAEALAAYEAERKLANERPFAELKADVQKTFKTPGLTGPEYGGVS